MIPIVISGVALIVAALSFGVSSEKLRLDLYNRRFDIYTKTLNFYHALLDLQESYDKGVFPSRRSEFIIACRESKFLFDPASGVYDRLNRLNRESFKITGLRDLGKGYPPEEFLKLSKEAGTAQELWNISMDSLEDAMAPYLNFHYISTWSAIVSKARRMCQKICSHRSLSSN